MSNKKFILNSTELGRYILEDDPLGWDEGKKVYSRKMEYLGIFRKRVETLKFIGDGLDYCERLFKLRGTESVLNITVQEKLDYQDAWTLEFEGIAKFNPYDLEWDDDLSPTLSVDFEDSGFHNKFLARAGMDINSGLQESIEGVDMGAIPTKQIQVHQRTIVGVNTFVLSEWPNYYFNVIEPDTYIPSIKGHVVPIIKTSGDSDNVQTPIDYLLASPGMIIDFVTLPLGIKIKYHFKGDFNNLDGTNTGWYVRIFNDSADLSDVTDIPLFEEPGVTPTPETGEPFDFSGVVDINLNVGQAFTIVCEFDQGDPATPSYIVVYEIADVTIEDIVFINEYVSNCHYRYEFMKRLTQLMTDQDDSFNSSVFGRLEIGYPADGRFWNNVVFSGKQLRGFPDEFPTRSFEKSFKSARAIWNLGCGIERFGARYKVVVEELPYFFRGDISITLHNIRKVGRKISNDFTFSEVRVGYEKAEYEEVNGLEEYNNKSVMATFIKSDDRILDLLSPDRADGYGMQFARMKNIQISATEDTQYDSEVFTAMVRKDGDLLRTEKDENYDDVSNIQSPETAMNLDITPQRNLLRNGDWINGCCYKFPEEELKHLSADKPTDLSTTRTGETDPVVEQSSVPNGSLISSLWLNLNYHFESDITQEQIKTLERKQFSLIKFSPFSRQKTKKYYYGWIWEATVGGKERSGNFVLLAANINSDRLFIVDPEGIYQEPPGSPEVPTPGVDDFGYEYAFEKLFES